MWPSRPDPWCCTGWPVHLASACPWVIYTARSLIGRSGRAGAWISPWNSVKFLAELFAAGERGGTLQFYVVP